ncbi:MAG: hypothetical protein ACOZQL_08610 [Myxococcota bacterium]
MQKPAVAVVVIESTEVRQSVTITLEAEGWVVLPLEDAAELFDFIEFLRENPLRLGAPRLVVTEPGLPGPSLFEVIAWARVCGLTLPFIVLTPDDDDDAKERARSLGAVELKPSLAA